MYFTAIERVSGECRVHSEAAELNTNTHTHTSSDTSVPAVAC